MSYLGVGIEEVGCFVDVGWPFSRSGAITGLGYVEIVILI
jgi:hypothetical protein